MVDSVLPDVLREGLDAVICGTAAGNRSAARREYYAHSSNRFWRILHETELTPRLLCPREFHLLPNFGIGLTDLAKRTSGSDAKLRPNDFDVEGLLTKIRTYQPRLLAFNGKKAASKVLGNEVQYGLQLERIGDTRLFVLHQTSGGNAHWKDETWHAMACWLSRGAD